MFFVRVTLLGCMCAGLPYLLGCVTSTAGSPTEPGRGASGEEPRADAPATVDATSALASAKIDPQTEPSIPILDLVVTQGRCVRLEKMPVTLARLPDADFRLELGRKVSDERRSAGAALTEWLLLAAQYQELCNLYGADDHNAIKYVDDGLPLEEAVVERAVARGRCGFLSKVDETQTWPYEVHFGEEILRRDFNEAEITRQLWRSTLEDYLKTCGEALPRRAKIRAETQIRRLDRIIGLDDPTLIDLRSKMLDALESGREQQVLAYARAVAERESALDSRSSADFEAKLASIEKTLTEERAALAEEAKTLREASQNAKAGGDMAARSAAAADTVENVARGAKAAQSTARIIRSFL
jgi:hypothetical protein